MSIVGKYQLEKNTHFTEHLVALGIAEDKAKIVDGLKPILEIEMVDNKLILTSTTGEYIHKSDLIFNVEVDESVGPEISLKSIAKRLNDQTIEILSTGTCGEKGRRRLESTETKLVMTIENDSKAIPVAKRYYRRIED